MSADTRFGTASVPFVGAIIDRPRALNKRPYKLGSAQLPFLSLRGSAHAAVAIRSAFLGRPRLLPVSTSWPRSGFPAAFGSCAAGLLGLPMELVTACGMVGLFCGVTNSPITSLLIAFELFGFEGMPYYLTTVAVSFMLSGYHSLYHKQRISYSKTEPHYWLPDK